MTMHKIIISGFGGQGVMMMGQMIAYAGMLEDRQVTWLPAYGPEMRGGTANCSIIVSDKPISSPIISKATAIVAMNYPSLLKFESVVMTSGLLLINASLIQEKTTRADLVTLEIPVNDIAVALKNDKAANMVMLGALIYCTKVVEPLSLYKVIEKLFTGDKAAMIPSNQFAIETGMNFVRQKGI
jgi:2-oxoglutarate ferredoxin oxidoreductase subunit gamma